MKATSRPLKRYEVQQGTRLHVWVEPKPLGEKIAYTAKVTYLEEAGKPRILDCVSITESARSNPAVAVLRADESVRGEILVNFAAPQTSAKVCCRLFRLDQDGKEVEHGSEQGRVVNSCEVDATGRVKLQFAMI